MIIENSYSNKFIAQIVTFNFPLWIMSRDFITLSIIHKPYSNSKTKTLKSKLLISLSVVNFSELLKHHVYMYLNAFYLNIP